MINVKIRVKCFYAASGIILLLRENNRPSGVKGCLQETVLYTRECLLGQKGKNRWKYSWLLYNTEVRAVHPAQSKLCL